MADVNIDIALGSQPKPEPRSPETPFRIAILGDFSGRAHRGTRPPVRAFRIDPDNFEQVMERLETSIDLPGAGVIRFRELDDFHPDHLYQTLALFQTVRETKKQLADPRTFRAAAETLRPSAPPPPMPSIRSGSLLDEIVGGDSPAQASAAAPARFASPAEASWDQVIQQIAARHAVPGRDPKQEEAIALVEQVAAVQLRALLSNPDFQRIEAAWRSIFFLLRYIETGAELRIDLIDIAKDELLEKQGELAKMFAGQPLGEVPWSLIAGLFTFSVNPADCALLEKLGAIAHRAGAPFLAAMHSSLFGCESIDETPDPDEWKTPLGAENAQAWQALRQSPHAASIGLAFPRFLLRLPYGKKTSPIESFDFEEMPNAPDHGAYLWGNAAMACTALLGQSFNQRGWEMHPGSPNQLEGIPFHSFSMTVDPTPTAEIWMTERLASDIAEAGVMPLASLKHSDAVLLVRFQSIARPAQPLSGAW